MIIWQWIGYKFFLNDPKYKTKKFKYSVTYLLAIATITIENEIKRVNNGCKIA